VRGDLPRRCVGYREARARFGPEIDRIVDLYAVGDPGEDRSDAPPWLDPERADRGGLVLRRHGLLGAAVLRCYALPLSYLSPAGVVPLVHTGELVREAAARLYRTAQMVREAQQPGALHPGGPAWRTAAHVRAMHQRVRESLWAAGWDPADGAPIPQPDSAATALLFGPLTVEGLRTMGCAIDDDEADAVAHVSRAMAWGQGVVDELQVDTHADALGLFARITSLDGPATDDGRALMDALLDIPSTLARRRRDRLAAPVLRRLYADLAVVMLGSEHAASLGLRTSGALARPVQWLARIRVLHAPNLAPMHDEVVAGVVERGFRRIRARGGPPPPAPLRIRGV